MSSRERSEACFRQGPRAGNSHTERLHLSQRYSLYGRQVCIPLRNREATGLERGETLDITFKLDTDERTIEIPADLEKTLTAAGCETWDALSYSRQREYAEAVTGAKKADARAAQAANRLKSYKS